MRRKIVTVMVVTALLAVGLFALPLAVLVAKYLIDDERSELTHAADLLPVDYLPETRAAQGAEQRRVDSLDADRWYPSAE
jgi:hypothetical protein